ncbi:MAG: efflux transporter periplasmic adaptor subunit [Proteobacteria bacterium SG_bin5]|uniref:efflux RND transporter periplasmic adaptor subunit n=1 Tax=unclassified Sphingomonas TaxID=196159 RepID=UPI000A0A5DFE|nr:efflux RND transporter periplasmic adaptor subunit [Sphingomonas sp. SFZ2018-12]MBX9813153.1 efflux RND transporter periplasmic adaptor subunit [Sphingomonas sp.]MCH4894050.1 efflux RND transporter periplasmic adaptor subunit [Sphingomonas sp. SFZ2018-12]OQW43631.1 MAG: efflux transporter periplasmic adaptor subunit [Proteobacteria bacterium SG_bin5]
MTSSRFQAASPLLLAVLLAACSGQAAKEASGEKTEAAGEAKGESGKKADTVKLSADQIRTAGIEIVHPTVGGNGGAIELPATVEGNPQGTQIVSAAIAGRVVALNRNLGEAVRRGETLAVVESREAASLKGEVEAARARLALAQSNYAREQRLYAERVSPEQDLIAARTAATEANIALRLARQQLSATGGGGGSLNRVGIVAPIAGQVIGRNAMLGQTVAADAELFRVANLSTVSLSLSLSPADAGRVHPGATVEMTAPGRTTQARVTFVSPALDPQTRLVPVVATIDNRGGQWRVGESVTAAIQLVGAGDTSIRVPLTSIQTIDGKSVVFVRTDDGFKATPVTLGAQSGETVVIASGLTGREQVASTNSFILKSELGKSAGGDED